MLEYLRSKAPRSSGPTADGEAVLYAGTVRNTTSEGIWVTLDLTGAVEGPCDMPWPLPDGERVTLGFDENERPWIVASATTGPTSSASGPAGGDLGGTYPNPTVVTINGTAVSAVVFNSDSRLTDSRAPSGAAGGDLTGTYPNPTIGALKVADGNVATANKDGTSATPSMRTLGTGAAQACAGNDARLSNSRTPTGHHASHEPGGSDALDLTTMVRSGTLASRPSASTSLNGVQYWATDQAAMYLCVSAAWVRVSTPAGVEDDYAGGTIPTGYVAEDGSAVSRTGIYADLFAAIGTTFGVGDGSTTFNVPDSRGRTIIGDGTGSGLTARTRGGTGGAEGVTLSSAESGVAVHGHGVTDPGHNHAPTTGTGFGVSVAGTANLGAGSNFSVAATTGTRTTGLTVNNATGAAASSAHNNMQPWLAVKKMIKL